MEADAGQKTLIDRLTELSPGLSEVLREHLADMDGELLPHLFFGDLTRYVVALCGRAESSADAARELDAILGFLEERMARGTEPEDNLISVSFLENLPYPWEAGAGLRYRLGPTLTKQLQVIAPYDKRLRSPSS